MLDKKLKVFVISDHILAPSGVGTQTNYMIRGLLNTGNYQFVCFGGAIKHNDLRPMRFKEFGEDLTVIPVEGYGTPDQVRAVIRDFKPDILWFMTDPRFYGWLWNIADEIRQQVPMIYYHVWDNYPYPKFNRKFYLSNDKIATISKLTSDIVRTVAPEVEEEYVPHAIDPSIYKSLDEKSYEHLIEDKNKTLFFWTNRNARRKMSGSVVWWFKKFLDIVGEDKAQLIMHTDPKDPNGQDLEAIAKELNLKRQNFAISNQKISMEQMAHFYNAADCTINISDAEGFGLSVLESLSCGTPVIANKTGGMQDQMTDGIEEFGVLINPASKAIIGSQEVPYIYEDRVSEKDFIDALLKIHNMPREERKLLGKKGQEFVSKNFNFEDYISRWDKLFKECYEKNGSWEERKNYKSWSLKEF